jgi:2-polyprenyl-6-methoxyphenol hydroxylase-like FAD-dependent oxidoreductase
MSTPSPVDVCVRGAGAVGATLALALAREGLSVRLVARPAPASGAAPSDDVRAYALNAASRSLLARLKVWDALPADAVTAVHDMQVNGDAPAGARVPGRIDFSAWQQGVDALAWIVDAAELDRTLDTALRFAPAVQRVADDAPEAGAALTVLAEGKHSATRDALGVRTQRHAYDHWALATRLVGELPHANRALQWFADGDVLALLPMDRPLPGRSWALVWSQAPERARSWHAADDDALAAVLAQRTAGTVGVLRPAGARALWPLQLARAERIVGPGWALVGDAAHVVHPLAGQGLNLGLADVDSLARVLAAREPWRGLGDEALLRRHARARAADVLAMATVTDGLLNLFAHDTPGLRLARNLGLSLVDRLSPLKRRLVAQALGPGAAG